MNKPDSLWHEWNELPDVYVRLQKDDMGYPPKEWEQLKAKPTSTDGVYQLQNTPFYARGLATGDEVLTHTSPEGFYPVVKSVQKRSGFSTVRLLISDEEERQALIDYFTGHGCRLEFCREIESLVSIAIPKTAFEEVYDYIRLERDKGRWGAEDGFIVFDEGNDAPQN
jgi:hypothetical protein